MIVLGTPLQSAVNASLVHILNLGVRTRRMRGQSLTSSLFKSLQEKGHLPLPQDSNQNNVIVES
ncbi:hypothetical protein HID58_071784 [Brassica napus]|uniref:Uncharacterized protein n=1 Tax=Brassica napus TaxID=3708 RepID=A0ABQ7Z2K3_BRANA|nr:hypothetical protein HID58_071784 [Brassica napus]